jgi:5'-3' exonuclease
MGIQSFLDLPKKKVPEAKKHILYTFFRGKRIAVDLSIIKNEAYAIAFGEVVKKTDLFVQEVDMERVTEVFTRIFMTRILSWLKNGFSLVMVLDGAPPESKNNTREQRKQDKMKKINDYNELLNKYRGYPINYRSPQLLTELRSKCMYTYIMGSDIHDLSANICRTLGLPVLQARYEAEWLCCSLYREGYVSGIISTDTDVYAHGCNCLLVTSDDEFHVNGEKVRSFNTVDIEHLLRGLGLNFNQFLDCCILAGCDYNERVRIKGGKNKIAMITGYNLIKKHGAIENINNIENPHLINLYECRKNFKPQAVSFNYEGELNLKNININLNVLNESMIREDFSQYKIEAYIYQISELYKNFPILDQVTYPMQKMQYVEDTHNNIISGGVGNNFGCIPINNTSTKPLTPEQLYEQYKESNPELIFSSGSGGNFSFSEQPETPTFSFDTEAPNFTTSTPTFTFSTPTTSTPSFATNNPFSTPNFATPITKPVTTPIFTSSFASSTPTFSFSTPILTSSIPTFPSSISSFTINNPFSTPVANSTPSFTINNPFSITIPPTTPSSTPTYILPTIDIFSQNVKDPLANPLPLNIKKPLISPTPTSKEDFSMSHLYVNNNIQGITDQDIFNFGNLSLEANIPKESFVVEESFIPTKDVIVVSTKKYTDTPINFVV